MAVHVQSLMCVRECILSTVFLKVFLSPWLQCHHLPCDLSWRLTLPVTIVHCLLEEQRLRHTEFTVRTLKSPTWTWIKHEVLLWVLSPSILLSFRKVDYIWTHVDHTQAALSETVEDRWSGNRKAKNKRPFVHSDPVLTWHITQSEDVASVQQVNLTNWWMTKKEPFCYF